MIAEALRLSLGRLRANLLRTALTVLGIVIGIAAVVALVSLGTAVEASIDDQFASLGADSVTVQPGTGDTPTAPGRGEPGSNLVTSPSGSTDPLTLDDVEAVAAVSSAGVTAPIVRDRVEVGVDGNRTDLTLIATTEALAATDGLQAAAGGFLPPIATEQGLPVAVLGSAAADELGLDASAIGSTVELDGRTYALVGILEPVGGISFVNPDAAVIVPLDVAEGTLVERDPDVDQIRVLALDGQVADLPDEVTSAVRTSRGLEANDEDDFSLVEATSIIDIANETSGLLTTLTTSIGAIALVVGAIGIANMMLVAVRERTREIGIRRAVGATRFDITGQFLSESVVLSVLGGLVGTAFGVALAVVLAESLLGVPAAVSGFAIAVALGVSALVGVAAGIGPAWQAASVDPTTALRYE